MTSSRAHVDSVERGPRRKLRGLVWGTGAEPILGPRPSGMLGSSWCCLASPRGPESWVWTVPPPLLALLVGPPPGSLKDSRREASHQVHGSRLGPVLSGLPASCGGRALSSPRVGAKQGQHGPEQAARHVSLLDYKSLAAVGSRVFLSLL